MKYHKHKIKSKYFDRGRFGVLAKIVNLETRMLDCSVCEKTTPHVYTGKTYSCLNHEGVENRKWQKK